MNIIVKFCITFLLFLSINFQGLGQNIYDKANSIRYANYLFDSGDFENAAKEYERISFMSDSVWIKHQLVRSYRYSGKYVKGLQRFSELFKNQTINPEINEEKLRLLLLSNQFSMADSLILSTSLPNVPDWQIKSKILAQDWVNSQALIAQNENLPNHNTYKSLLQEQTQLPRKSPFVAGALSTLVPGIGKIYAKDWKDGVVGLVFIGSMFFQSYRGFSQKGVQSTAGWIYGSIGLGFHIGNIYGSVRSAKLYNKRQNEIFYNKVKAVCYSDF